MENNIGLKSRVLRQAILILLVVIFLLFMFPFILVVINSFKTKRDIIVDPITLSPKNGFIISNFTEAFNKMNFMQVFSNSFIITGASTLLVLLLAAKVAYYFVRNNNGITKLFFPLMIASMIIPFQAIMIPLVTIYGSGLNLLNKREILIFFHVGFGMSMSVFMYHGFIKSSIPLELEEAAYIDGSTKLQTFFKIVLPMLKPTTATLAILNVLAYWNDYLLPSLVLTRKELLTLPLSTYLFYGTYSADFGVIMAALVLTVAPVLLLYLLLQKQIIEGVLSGAVKS